MADQYLSPTPYANQFTGYSNDLIQGLLGYMKDKQRTQQMQGLAGLLESTGIPQSVERSAYAQSPKALLDALTNVNRANVPLLKAETADALMTLAPVAGPAAKLLPKNLPVGLSIKPLDDMAALLTPKKSSFDVARRDASDIFGAGAERVKYTDPKSGGMIEVLAKPDGSASVLGLEVPETARGKGIGQSLQAKVMQDFPEMMGQVSSKAAAKTAYRLGRRPPNMPDATIDDVYKMLKEDSSVNLVSPQMQKRFMPEATQEFAYPQEEAMMLAQQRAALPLEQGGLGLLEKNTAADRAKAMGFDTDTLHGSPNAYIEQFDPMMAGGNTGNTFDNNIFSTSSPESAGGYALNWKYYRNTIKNNPEFKAITNEENSLLRSLGSYREQGNTKAFDEARARLDVLADQKTNIYNDFMNGKLGSEGSSVYPLMVRSSEFLPYEANGLNWMKANRPAIDAAEAAGYSGALIKNVRDNAGANLGTIADVFATPDPAQFRSRFAAFDPFRKTAAIAASMGVAAPDLLAEESDKPKRRLNLLD